MSGEAIRPLRCPACKQTSDLDPMLLSLPYRATGAAIVKGTEDPAIARSVYARYIGT